MMKQKVLAAFLAAVLLMTTSVQAMASDTEDDGFVDVTFSITEGDHFYDDDGNIIAMKELSIPYFDLALYGLEEYYYNPSCYDNVKDPNDMSAVKIPGTADTADGNVTLLHAFIYATEVLHLEVPEKQAGKGVLYLSGEMDEYLSFSGGVGSIFTTNFWGLNYNLNYYVNYNYPMASVPGLGSTADQTLLEDGDHISLHSIVDKSGLITGTSYGLIEADDATNKLTVTKGDNVTLDLKYTAGSYGDTNLTEKVSVANANIHYTTELSSKPALWTKLGTSNSNGQFTVDTTNWAAGTYYIACDPNTVRLQDSSKQPAPALMVLTVEDNAPSILYGDVNGDGKVNSNDASLVLRYAAGLVREIDTTAADVNGDKKVNSNDASLVLRYAAGLIQKFPVENK